MIVELAGDPVVTLYLQRGLKERYEVHHGVRIAVSFR
jgi:ATP-dependent Clp protease ATP-binding subunit ClpA